MIVKEAFQRYKYIIFTRASKVSRSTAVSYDIQKLSIIVHSDNEEVILYLYVQEFNFLVV